MHHTTQMLWNSSLNPLVASSGSETINLQLLCLCYCLLTGCGHLRWLWPPPAGCLPLPPSGHSHCPVLQVQVQQRRWWPIANLNTPQGLEWRAAPRKGHLFFLFTPPPPFYILSLPAASSTSFFGLSLHQPTLPPGRFGIHRSAWERHGRKAALHLWPEERCRIKGQRRSDLSEDHCVHVCKTLVVGNVKEDWATLPWPYCGVTVVWYCGGSLRGKKISVRNAFLLYGQYHAGATLEDF